MSVDVVDSVRFDVIDPSPRVSVQVGFVRDDIERRRARIGFRRCVTRRFIKAELHISNALNPQIGRSTDVANADAIVARN